MATKRQLKKFIRNACGCIAAEMILARAAFPQIERKKAYDVIRDAAALQTRTLSRVNIGFDKAPDAFESIHAYRKGRRAYYAEAYSHLLKEFDEGINAIVKEMNAALPEEVRTAIKEAVNE